MLKSIPISKKVFVIFLLTCLSTLFFVAPALAHTGQASAATGWWVVDEDESKWWGSSFIQVDDVCSWTEAESTGMEHFVTTMLEAWHEDNKVYNSSYAGVTGYAILRKEGVPSGSKCLTLASGQWYPDFSGTVEDQAEINPHPYAQ